MTLLPIAHEQELDSLDLDAHKERIKATAMYALEEQGYYVKLSEDPMTYEDIKNMGVDELATIGDLGSNLLILITIEKIQGVNVAVLAAKAAKLNAKFIMKDSGNMILDKTRSTHTSASGLLGVMLNSSARENIASLCTEELLSDIPSCYEGFDITAFEKCMEEERKNAERRKRREERIKKSR